MMAHGACIKELAEDLATRASPIKSKGSKKAHGRSRRALLASGLLELGVLNNRKTRGFMDISEQKAKVYFFSTALK
jgi:hypothetical protein